MLLEVRVSGLQCFQSAGLKPISVSIGDRQGFGIRGFAELRFFFVCSSDKEVSVWVKMVG